MAHQDYFTNSNLRLKTIVRLRWIAIVGQLATVLAVYFGFKFAFPLGLALLVISMSVIVNLSLRYLYRDIMVVSDRFGAWMLGYDIIQLSVLLYLTGGILNPFVTLLVAPIAISAASLRTRSTVLLGVLAFFAASIIAFFYLPLPWHSVAGLEFPIAYRMGNWIAVLCAMTFIGFFAWRIANESRDMSAALVATEAVLAQEQKLSAIDGLAAAVAHRLSTPLSTISLTAKEVERELDKKSPLLGDIVLIRSEAARCREILQSLTDVSSDADFMVETSSLGDILEEAAQPLKALNANIEIKRFPCQAVPAPFDQEPLLRRNPGLIYALGNIVENAVEFADSKALVEACWSETELKILVQDDGNGFSSDVLDRLGEPFISTRFDGHARANGEQYGMGLGFFISKTLLERSGAVMKFGNRKGPEKGAFVTLDWPRHLIDLSFEDEMVNG